MYHDQSNRLFNGAESFLNMDYTITVNTHTWIEFCEGGGYWDGVMCLYDHGMLTAYTDVSGHPEIRLFFPDWDEMHVNEDWSIGYWIQFGPSIYFSNSGWIVDQLSGHLHSLFRINSDPSTYF